MGYEEWWREKGRYWRGGVKMATQDAWDDALENQWQPAETAPINEKIIIAGTETGFSSFVVLTKPLSYPYTHWMYQPKLPEVKK